MRIFTTQEWLRAVKSCPKGERHSANVAYLLDDTSCPCQQGGELTQPFLGAGKCNQRSVKTIPYHLTFFRASPSRTLSTPQFRATHFPAIHLRLTKLAPESDTGGFEASIRTLGPPKCQGDWSLVEITPRFPVPHSGTIILASQAASVS